MEFRDYSVILQGNCPKHESNILMKLLYSLIHLNPNDVSKNVKKINHALMIITVKGTKYIADSQINGFTIRKPLERWLADNKNKNIIIYEIPYKILFKYAVSPINEINIMDRVYFICGNKYDAKYWCYLILRISKWLNKVFGTKLLWVGDSDVLKSSNCLQSIAYIYDLEKPYMIDTDDFEKIIIENDLPCYYL